MKIPNNSIQCQTCGYIWDNDDLNRMIHRGLGYLRGARITSCRNCTEDKLYVEDQALSFLKIENVGKENLE
jgi:hypothetical protein